ncbi:MAG: PAS domain S-box protein [Usitatibacter sp.]
MTPFVIPIVWSMIAGACFAVGVMHLGASAKQPRQRASLAFSALTVSVMFLAIFELLLMHAREPAEYGAIQRWMQVPVFTAVVSTVAFVRAYFGTGREWLAWLVCGLRFAALVLNFVMSPNIEYSTITSLQRIEIFGEEASAAIGDANPWVAVGEASSFLLLAFIADASIAYWRRGDAVSRRRAAVVGGSLAFTVAVAAINAILMHAGVIHSIYFSSLAFAVVLVAFASELSADVARAGWLAGHLVEVESELRLSEKRMEQAAEAAAIATWEWDVVRDEVWVNARGRELFGIAPDVRIDFNGFLAALHPADRAAATVAVARSRAEGGAFEREYRVVLPGGRTRWINTRGGVDFDSRGNSVLLRGVSFDITARKEAEERFRLVVEAAANGLIMLDASGRISLVNARAESLFGFTREELVGRPIGDLIPEFHEHGLQGQWPRKLSAHETLGRRKDGSEIALEAGLEDLETSEGVGMLVSVVDVSERKRRDALLKRERAFLRQVIDIDPNLIFAKDRLGRFTLANQAVADVYGTSVEGLIGKTDSDFNDNADEVEGFRRDDLEVMDTRRELFIAEEQITDASGRHRVLQTVKRPILGEGGMASQVLGVSTDISARKQAEMQLVRQRDELAHLTRVTMVAELSGSLAHELNQPLAAILANAQAALAFMDEPHASFAEIRAILEDIVEDDKRAGQVIQGLRLLLKKGEMLREPLDLNAVVQDVLRLVRSDLLHAGVRLKTQLARGLPILDGDRVQLQQVVLNLIVNGCDAMAAEDAAERELVVSTAAVDGWVNISVTDRGPGITPDRVEQIFEPFFTTKSDGLGMGLAICRNIVTAHGGRLWAVNNATRGTTFRFTLPVTRSLP